MCHDVSQQRVRTTPHMTEAWWGEKVMKYFPVYWLFSVSHLDSFCPDQLAIHSEVARVATPGQDGLQPEGLDGEDLHPLGVEVASAKQLYKNGS